MRDPVTVAGLTLSVDNCHESRSDWLEVWRRFYLLLVCGGKINQPFLVIDRESQAFSQRRVWHLVVDGWSEGTVPKHPTSTRMFGDFMRNV